MHSTNVMQLLLAKLNSSVPPEPPNVPDLVQCDIFFSKNERHAQSPTFFT